MSQTKVLGSAAVTLVAGGSLILPLIRLLIRLCQLLPRQRLLLSSLLPHSLLHQPHTPHRRRQTHSTVSKQEAAVAVVILAAALKKLYW
jgi:hypothetical protein